MAELRDHSNRRRRASQKLCHSSDVDGTGFGSLLESDDIRDFESSQLEVSYIEDLL